MECTRSSERATEAQSNRRGVERAMGSDRKVIRTFALAALGGALEFYDFIIFVYLTRPIAQNFFPPEMPDWLRQVEVLGLFGAGYLARPLGGLVMSHMGDRSGRKRVFLLSVALMAIPTAVIGLLPGYAQIGHIAPLLLLSCRLLQGAAVGGEIPGAWVYVAEHAPSGRDGFANGLLTAGLTGGIILGALVDLTLNLTMTADQINSYAWRLPFLLGGVLGLAGVTLRRKLAETPVFEAMRREARLVDGLPVGDVLRDHKASVLASMAATWLLTAVIIVMTLMAPVLAQKRMALTGIGAASLGIAASALLPVGCVVTGLAIDRLGLRFATYAGVLLIIVAAYLEFDVTTLGPAYAAFAFAGFAGGAVCLVPVVMVRSFPPQVAFSGVALAYNVAYAVAGGLTPPLVTVLLGFDSLAPAHYVTFVCIVSGIAMLKASSGITVIGSARGASGRQSSDGRKPRDRTHGQG